MREPAWQRVSPLAIVFFLGQTIAKIAKNLWQTVLPASAYLATTGGFSLDRVAWLALAGLGVSTLYSVAAWWNTRYQMRQEELVVKAGVFQRRQLNLEYRNIQSVTETRNPIYRLAGVVDLKLDSPGSGDTEANLPALRPAIAAELQQRVQQARSAKTGLTEDMPAKTQAEKGDVLVRLTMGDLVRIGLSSNRALVFLAIAGSAFGALASQDVLFVYFDPAEFIEEYFWAIPETQSKVVIVGIGIAIAAAVFILLKLLSVIGAIIRFSGFTLLSERETLATHAGLLTQYGQTLTLAKVQIVKAGRGILQSLFGITSLRLSQTGGKAGRNDALDIPALTEKNMPAVLQRIAGPVFDNALTAPLKKPSSRFLVSRIWLFGALPGLAFVALAAANRQSLEALLIAAVWLLVVSVVSFLRYRRLGISSNHERLILRRGMLGRRWQLMETRKCQAVAFRQSPFQRRRGLVKLTVVNASNSVTMSYLPADVANDAAEHCLDAASNGQPWQ